MNKHLDKRQLKGIKLTLLNMKTKPITHTWSTEQPRSTSAEQEDSASQSCQLPRSQWRWGFQFCCQRWSQCWDCIPYLQWHHQNSHFYFRKHLVISLLSMCPYSCKNYQIETSTKEQTLTLMRLLGYSIDYLGCWTWQTR